MEAERAEKVERRRVGNLTPHPQGLTRGEKIEKRYHRLLLKKCGRNNMP